MRRLVLELLKGQRTHTPSYRSSSDDGLEQIGGLPVTEVTTIPVKKATTRLYTDEQLETSLSLLSVNSLVELGRKDFSCFKKKQSWIQLAQGCIQRLSSDLLLLRDVGETTERCSLLHHRLETRKAAKVRTPSEAQNSITTLYSASISVREMWKLSCGKRVRDMEGAVGRAQVVMGRWRTVMSLAPTVTPKTEEMIAMVKLAMNNVTRDSGSNELVKSIARRVLLQFSGSVAKVPGEQVSWDSD